MVVISQEIDFGNHRDKVKVWIAILGFFSVCLGDRLDQVKNKQEGYFCLLHRRGQSVQVFEQAVNLGQNLLVEKFVHGQIKIQSNHVRPVLGILGLTFVGLNVQGRPGWVGNTLYDKLQYLGHFKADVLRQLRHLSVCLDPINKQLKQGSADRWLVAIE